MDGQVKLRDLPRDQWARHIKDYYWVHILVAVCVLVVGGFYLYTIHQYREPILEVVMINTYKNRDEQIQVLQDILTEKGFDTFDGAVSVDTNIRFGGGDASDSASMNELMCTATAADGDLYFWKGKEFEAYVERGVLADLREYLPEELLAQYADRLIYCTLDADTPAYPCGIDLEDNSWALDHGYMDGGFVGISKGVTNPQSAVEILKTILA